MSETFLYIGVNSSSSLFKPVITLWYEELQLDRKIETLDLELNSPRAKYQELIHQISIDKTIRGVLITSHKIQFYNTGFKFSFIDKYALKLKEVSTLVRTKDGLAAYALDPFASGKILYTILEKYRSHDIKDIVILGAGGAATAICGYIFEEYWKSGVWRPKLSVLDNDVNRIAHIGNTFSLYEKDFFRLCVKDEIYTGEYIDTIKNAALIINATGVGKVMAGSPLPIRQTYYSGTVLWDLNYRGDLSFLRNSQIYSTEHPPSIEDGWELSLCGWMRTLETIEGISIIDNTRIRHNLERIANNVKEQHLRVNT